ncbi:MAG TPA: hypothetical protein VKY27_07965 [Bacteriovoracaceae bacterium]|nr:hypothetical protein [Bacteriovoracaceae bacterium]
MKLVLVFLLTLSFNCWSEEIKILLNKPSVYTGEVVSGRVENYPGPSLAEKRLDDTIHILSLDDEKIEMIFLKRPQTNRVTLDNDQQLSWNPVEVIEVETPENIIINDLIFELKDKSWILYLVASLLLIVLGAGLYFKKLRPYLLTKKRRREVKNALFAAHSFEEITGVWKNKHFYLETFPFIEEEFNKFEVVYYKYAFMPNISKENKNEVVKSYLKFLDQIRGGNFGV